MAILVSLLLMIYHLHWKWQLKKNLLGFNISSNFPVTSFRIRITPRVGSLRQIHPIEIDDDNRKDVYVHVKLLRNYPMELHITNPNQSNIKEVV